MGWKYVIKKKKILFMIKCSTKRNTPTIKWTHYKFQETHLFQESKCKTETQTFLKTKNYIWQNYQDLTKFFSTAIIYEQVFLKRKGKEKKKENKCSPVIGFFTAASLFWVLKNPLSSSLKKLLRILNAWNKKNGQIKWPQ